MNSSYATNRQLTEDEWIALGIIILVWLLLWLAFSTKMGYRGKVRWYLVLSSLIPGVSVINILALALIRWPIETENRLLKKQLKEGTSRNKATGKSEVDTDLERLRRNLDL